MKILLLLCFAVIISAISKASDTTFTINGKFDNLQNGKVYLSVYTSGKVTRDSAMVKNGSFKFTGAVKDVATAVLTREGKKNDYFMFYLEPLTEEITGSGDSLKL